MGGLLFGGPVTPVVDRMETPHHGRMSVVETRFACRRTCSSVLVIETTHAS
jgi:hypothetical protein